MKYIIIIIVLVSIAFIGFLGMKWIPVLRASNYKQMLTALYKKTVPFLYLNKKDKIKDISTYLLLDTRSREEYAVSSLPNSIWVGYPDIDKKVLATLSKDQAILVYCSVGYRSERIGEQLLEMGFVDVHNLYGGIFEWVNSGYAICDSTGQQINSIHGYSPSWGKWIESDIEVVY